jgi:transcriptional regulator with XRE-family HTH domain
VRVKNGALVQMKFAQILRQERELRGWSQSRAAQELGTTPNTVSAWERDLSLPSAYFREKLCNLFGKNAWELGLLPA